MDKLELDSSHSIFQIQAMISECNWDEAPHSPVFYLIHELSDEFLRSDQE